MAIFESITWQAVGVITVILSTLGAALVWTYNKVYGLGRTDDRVNNIEHILEVEYREKFKAIDKRFDRLDEKFDRLEERIDKRFNQFEERFKKSDERFDKLYGLLLKKQ